MTNRVARSARAGRAVGAGVLPLLLCSSALAGCGEAVVDGDAPSGANGSAVRVPADARDALGCDTRPYRTGAGDYADGGLERVQDDPAEAVEDLLEQEYVGEAPDDGYALTARNPTRALVTYEVEGAAKVAFVVTDGLTDWDGGEGWGVTSWAVCDPAELPASVTEDKDIGVWTDADGERVPVTRVSSSYGPEHCDWQEVVFLRLGEGPRDPLFLRDVQGVLADYETTSYGEVGAVPRDAESTGWRRDGRELWLAADGRAAYLVAVDDPTDVERWPGATESVACA